MRELAFLKPTERVEPFGVSLSLFTSGSCESTTDFYIYGWSFDFPAGLARTAPIGRTRMPPRKRGGRRGRARTGDERAARAATPDGVVGEGRRGGRARAAPAAVAAAAAAASKRVRFGASGEKTTKRRAMEVEAASPKAGEKRAVEGEGGGTGRRRRPRSHYCNPGRVMPSGSVWCPEAVALRRRHLY